MAFRSTRAEDAQSEQTSAIDAYFNNAQDTNVRSSHKAYTPRVHSFSCNQLCGRVSPCGNKHCSNYVHKQGK